MDDRVIKAALDSFESDDFLHAKELVQGQIKQARNDFIKSKLGLKNDIEQQFVQVEPGTEPDIKTTDPFMGELTPDENDDQKPTPKKRMLTKKKKI